MMNANTNAVDTRKRWKVYAHMNANYGDYDTTYIVEAPNKTVARMIAKGELNPCRILKIEEV